MLTQQGTMVSPARGVASLSRISPRFPVQRPAPSAPARRRLPAFVTAPWFVPLLITAALGFYRITSIVLWWDELSTLDIIERPVSGIIATAGHVDAVHSFYYLFMHFWVMVFGTSVFAMRLPSLLAMCGATVCTALIAQRLFDRRVAYTAAFVFSLVPGVDRYACEARSYGLVVLGSALALLLLLRALERPGLRRWAGYGALVAVTGALNLIALTGLAAHLVAVLVSRTGGRRERLRAFAIAVGAALVLVSPVAVFGMIEAGSQLGTLPQYSLSSLPLLWQETGCSTSFSVLVVLALPFAALHRMHRSAAVVVGAATLPIMALWVVSVNSIGFSFFARYLLFVLPAWAIAVAAAVDRFKGVHPFAFVAVVLLTAVAVTHDQIVLHGPLSHFEYDYPGPDVRAEDYPAAAEVISGHYEPGDAASFATSTHLDLGVNYYLPASEQLPDIFIQRSDVQMDSLEPEFCTSTAACAAKAPDRVWLVESGAGQGYATEPVNWAYTLQYLYRTVEVWHVNGITLTLLERGTAR
jgi:mannosyltransferase